MRRQEIASLVFSSSDFPLRPYLIYMVRELSHMVMFIKREECFTKYA